MTPLMILAWCAVALVAYITSPLWIPILLIIFGAIAVAFMFLVAWIFDAVNFSRWNRKRQLRKFNKRIGK